MGVDGHRFDHHVASPLLAFPALCGGINIAGFRISCAWLEEAPGCCSRCFCSNSWRNWKNWEWWYEDSMWKLQSYPVIPFLDEVEHGGIIPYHSLSSPGIPCWNGHERHGSKATCGLDQLWDKRGFQVHQTPQRFRRGDTVTLPPVSNVGVRDKLEKTLIWLVVWNIFFHILGMSYSQLTNIFQRGWNHQPAYIAWKKPMVSCRFPTLNQSASVKREPSGSSCLTHSNVAEGCPKTAKSGSAVTTISSNLQNFGVPPTVRPCKTMHACRNPQ